MLKAHRCYAICLFLMVAAFLLTSNVHCEGYKGFLKLNPDECVPLDKKIVLQLSAEWHKYADFVKICALTQKKGQPAKGSIISVWVEEYYGTLPSDAMWEKFPLPLIVDDHFQKIGQLPELYPMDQPRELDVYYGKWQLGMPTEIMVDVHNPAVSGDYYYDSLIWNKDRGTYEMKSEGERYGRRKR
ncbi:MAG TPA: hypothetical protein VKF36_06895 [Syntrophorhabdales bacterium]|nr:hypothetical protein [Syntrophorhabdales bacterium]